MGLLPTLFLNMGFVANTAVQYVSFYPVVVVVVGDAAATDRRHRRVVFPVFIVDKNANSIFLHFIIYDSHQLADRNEIPHTDLQKYFLGIMLVRLFLVGLFSARGAYTKTKKIKCIEKEENHERKFQVGLLTPV